MHTLPTHWPMLHPKQQPPTPTGHKLEHACEHCACVVQLPPIVVVVGGNVVIVVVDVVVVDEDVTCSVA